MTWPFENNTSAIEKKLAKRSLAADRHRNLVAVITISLSVCLMALMAFIQTAVSERTLSQIRDQYQSGCINLSYEEIDRLTAAGKFEQWGYQSETYNVRYKDANLSIQFYDEGMRKLMQTSAITGSYPQERNEICVEREFLKYFTLPEEIGQTLSLNLGNGEQNYTISGILETENTSRQFELYISEALAASQSEEPFILLFRFAGEYTGQPEQLQADIRTFYEEMGIPENEIFFSSNYFDLTDFYLGSDTSIYVVAALIAIACSVVIYNIFYISVMGKLREYGRLKVIGTTPRQLWQVVKRERRALLWVGVLVGLLIAVVLTNILFPGYWNWGKNLKYAAIVVVITVVVVSFSTRKPLRMAEKVSAMEAVRSSTYQDAPSASKTLHRPLSIFRLACMNFSRNRKKAALTLISLGMTGILTACIAACASSVNVEEMARHSFGDGGDYVLSIEDNTDLAQMQTEKLLGLDTRERLLRLPDVDFLTAYSSAYCTIAQSPMPDNLFLVGGFTAEQIAFYQEKDAIAEETVDYNELLQNNGIVIVRDYENLLKNLYHMNLSLGDTITLQSAEGISKDYTVMGIVNAFQPGAGTAKLFILPEEELHTIYPNIEDFTGYINIHVTESSDQQRQELYTFLDDPRIEIVCLVDLISSTETNLQAILLLLYGMVAFIALFALINLINTMITNLLTRQQEFGIFQSVGMTNRQLSRMISDECLCYVGATLLITLSIGTVCGMAVVQKFNQIGLFGKLTYHFPAEVMLIFSGVLVVVYSAFRLAAVRFLQKQSMVFGIYKVD